jgi:hypothetical protein
MMLPHLLPRNNRNKIPSLGSNSSRNNSNNQEDNNSPDREEPTTLLNMLSELVY